MNRVKIELENCYGINKLSHQFDFTQKKAFAVYAPNGSMKTSLAQTFSDVALGLPSKDRIFPTRNTVRRITDENDAPVPKESVLVLPPYVEPSDPTEKTSTLLVNSRLQQEHGQLHADLNKLKEKFLKAMKEQSGTRKKWQDLEDEISLAFVPTADAFYLAINRIKVKKVPLFPNSHTIPFSMKKYLSFYLPLTSKPPFKRISTAIISL